MPRRGGWPRPRWRLREAYYLSVWTFPPLSTPPGGRRLRP